MSAHEKLIRRFKSLPQNFTWRELERLLAGFGYMQIQGNGSRVRFVCDGRRSLSLHKPHPSPIIKKYALKQVRESLIEEKLL